jgi:hypothetical protein
MSILKNFVNPWESTGELGSQALGTEALEGNVLNENSTKVKSERTYAIVYYAFNTDISENIVTKAINYAKQIFRLNGVNWLEFINIQPNGELYEVAYNVSNIYDSALIITSAKNSHSDIFKSYIDCFDGINKINDYRLIGYEIAHELLHQYAMRLGWVLWGYRHYLQPHGNQIADGGYDEAHFNYNSDGSIRINLLVSGHILQKKQGAYKSSQGQKMIPYHKFLMSRFYSMMNLDNAIIASQNESYFYYDEPVEVENDYPLPLQYVALYKRRRDLLINGRAPSEVYDVNLSPYYIQPSSISSETYFDADKKQQKIFLEEYP